jgi:1-acyl-sn-glycerol-3-phosphate acyltransferase
MIVLRFLLSLFYWIYLQIAILLVALLSFPARLLPNKGRAFIYFLSKFALRALFFICFIRVKITGREKLLEHGRSIFLCNKPNMIATFGLIAYFPLRVRIVAEEKLLKFPVLGRLVKSLGCVASTGKKEDSFVFANAIISSLKGNEPVLFYPENIRLKGRKVLPFKQTELKLAKIAEASIVPLIVRGSEGVLPEDSAIISPGKIKITVGSPIALREGGDLGEIARELEAVYKNSLAEVK